MIHYTIIHICLLVPFSFLHFVIAKPPGDRCFSGGLLGPDGTNRHLGKWCKRANKKGPAALSTGGSTGDLIAVGADGRGGRIKVLRSLNHPSLVCLFFFSPSLRLKLKYRSKMVISIKIQVLCKKSQMSLLISNFSKICGTLFCKSTIGYQYLFKQMFILFYIYLFFLLLCHGCSCNWRHQEFGM